MFLPCPAAEEEQIAGGPGCGAPDNFSGGATPVADMYGAVMIQPGMVQAFE
jgi:hypothetical protein